MLGFATKAEVQLLRKAMAEMVESQIYVMETLKSVTGYILEIEKETINKTKESK